MLHAAVLSATTRASTRRVFGRRSGRPSRWRFYSNSWPTGGTSSRSTAYAFRRGHEPRHTFACFRQIQRAFEQIFRDIIGSSMPAARLRAAVWQSIFTHDMRRYRRTLYARMGEFATLITGPSGTGKELAARAIAAVALRAVRRTPADVSRTTDAAGVLPDQYFRALADAGGIGAVRPPPRRVHRRDRATARAGSKPVPELGAVFLDELGDLDPAIQVKLLRVIETRTFHPVGDTAGRQFRGQADRGHQSRPGGAACARAASARTSTTGCARTRSPRPSLAEQLADSPQVLRELVLYMSRRVAGRGGRRAGARSDALDRENLGAGLRLARQLSRTGAVRARTC